jgi:hypothetical protein
MLIAIIRGVVLFGAYYAYQTLKKIRVDAYLHACTHQTMLTSLSHIIGTCKRSDCGSGHVYRVTLLEGFIGMVVRLD